MCGAGTILAETIDLARRRRLGTLRVWGGDHDAVALRATASNLHRVGPVLLACWDATRLPLPDAVVDCLVSNPPFGKQLSRPEDIGLLYRRMVPEYDRVVRPGGRVVLLVSAYAVLRQAARAAGWKCLEQVDLRVLGQPAVISVWRKSGQFATMER
jgi:tRNA G10  N-methylase Trm11